MSLKIRMSRAGAKKQPHYRIVIADTRSPRDGKFIEKVGTYDPRLKSDDPKRVNLNAERIKYWMGHGATPSERVAKFLGAAQIIPVPARRNSPQKSLPKAKAQERVKAAAEATAKAETAAAAAAPAAAGPAPAES